MVDLADIGIEWLIYSIPRTRNTAALIEYLRQNGKVTPELKKLIADVLDGKIKATAKPKKLKDIFATGGNGRAGPSIYLLAEIEAFKRMLQTPLAAEWEETKEMLATAGYVGTPETKGEITKAAKKMLAYSLRITSAQLDELLSPRKARSKNW